MEQGDLLAGVPPLSAREIGHAVAKAATRAAEEQEQFDAKGAAQFIWSWVLRHGPTPGEELVKQAMAHGFKVKDGRRYGGVFIGLVNAGKLVVLRSDLPREHGHGTTGGKLYGAGQA